MNGLRAAISGIKFYSILCKLISDMIELTFEGGMLNLIIPENRIKPDLYRETVQ